VKRCDRCGLPRKLSERYVWQGNGVILSRRDPEMRMVMFEADYYPYVWSELERRLGVNAADAMIRGQQAATREYLADHILIGLRGLMARYLPTRVVFDAVMKEMALLGFCRMELLAHRWREFVVLRVVSPFDIISIAWGAKGFLEYSTGKEAQLSWRKEGDDYILTIVLLPRGAARGAFDREALETIREAKKELLLGGEFIPPGEDRGDPCPFCGLPRALTELEWVEDEGVIRRRDSGRRYIFSSGHIFIGVVRDLQRKLGKELESLVTEITKEYHLRDLRGISIRTRHGAYRAAVRYLLAGGFGNVMEYSYGEGHLEMTIANPFYLPRLVGRIAGLFEYLEGEEALIEHRMVEPRVLRLELRTA